MTAVAGHMARDKVAALVLRTEWTLCRQTPTHGDAAPTDPSARSHTVVTCVHTGREVEDMGQKPRSPDL